MAALPYMTTDDLVNSIKRKISVPLSQQTFTANDVISFLNEEMFIAQVPSVLSYHEEYFVRYDVTSITANVSRYAIPTRAVGMKLRDIFWMDSQGNLFEMTRINEHDKAYFQSNVGANQAIHKYYVEGNYVVLSPSITDSPTGSIVFVYYLRPNQLVKNDRAATVVGFNQTITINNSLIQALDTVNLGSNIFTAVNTLGGSITAITSLSSTTTQITSASHQLSNGQSVTITSSNCNPTINSTWTVTVVDANTFNINTEIATAGSAGAFTSTNQFQIGATSALTGANLNSSINSSGVITSSSVNSNIVTLLYSNIQMSLSTSRRTAFVIPSSTIGIKFNAVNSTYTDSETNVTETLFINGSKIDLLQTNPGHQTYVFDVIIPSSGISSSSVYFNSADLLVPTGSVNNGIQYQTANIQVGDYMCLANEAIIPQIPPDLHNGLAEYGASRILAALGDQAGLQASQAKIQQIEQRTGNLIDNRAEGTPQKILNRSSLLRYGKSGISRKY